MQLVCALRRAKLTFAAIESARSPDNGGPFTLDVSGLLVCEFSIVRAALEAHRHLEFIYIRVGI